MDVHHGCCAGLDVHKATVVACAARLTGEGPVRIGLPLAGWGLAVVDPAGRLVAMGETGELVIGGIGLARYLDAGFFNQA